MHQAACLLMISILYAQEAWVLYWYGRRGASAVVRASGSVCVGARAFDVGSWEGGDGGRTGGPRRVRRLAKGLLPGLYTHRAETGACSKSVAIRGKQAFHLPGFVSGC